VPDEHEVSELDDTAKRQRAEQRLPRWTAWMSPIPGSLRGEAEPWRYCRKRVEHALAPAEGLAVAMLIATLLWVLIAWIVERISLVMAIG
jgi:hypothetical protein